MNRKRILLIGGTGSMGVYLTDLLLKQNYQVEVAAIAPGEIEHPNLQSFIIDARDIGNLTRLLETRPDAVIDFLDYKPAEYRKRCELFLRHTKHYFFLSSYRVYTDLDPVTTEESPLQKDAAPDLEFRNSDDYSIYKAQNEEILRAMPYDHWTIVRPSIIFSKFSLPLTSLGANCIYNRAMEKKPALIADSAVEVQSTCTWSGDIAKLFAGLLFRPDTFRETYSLCTGEHRSWGEWAEAYRELIGLETWTVPQEEFEGIYWNRAQWALYQFRYDRMLNRVLDNSKVLKAAGLKQSDLTPVWKALEFELRRFPADYRFPGGEELNANMDRYLARGGTILRKF